MIPWYLLGEPLFHPELAAEHWAPIGQVRAVLKVLEEGESEELVLDRWRTEYLSVVDALIQMQVPFRVCITHRDYLDRPTMKELEHRDCGFAEFAPALMPGLNVFVRDLCTTLPGLVLMNDEAFQPTSLETGGVLHRTSPLGMGGRVLHAGDSVVVNALLRRERTANNNLSPIAKDEQDGIRRLGLQVATFPAVCCEWFNIERSIGYEFFGDDHVDRSACLLRGQSNEVHLVLAPKLQPLTLSGRWQDPEEYKEEFLNQWSDMGIKVTVLDGISVPYALNLIQFEDGRVLMTSGDDHTLSVVSQIVGKESVHMTSEPIRFFPAWAQSGIRCLLNRTDWLFTVAMRQL